MKGATNIQKKMTKKKIVTEYGDVKHLTEVFGFKNSTSVRSALNYKTNSALAKRIRTYAVKTMGRKVMEY